MVCLVISLIFVFLIFFLIYLKINLVQKRRAYRVEKSIDHGARVVAFFHPYCNAGGGGERVLWAAIKALHQQFPDDHILIYSDDYNVTPAEIVSKAQNNFQIKLPENIHFVTLKTVNLLSPKLYPFCTLLAQSLGSLVVGAEALWRCPPDVMIDTMGASFIYPLFRYLAAAKVGAYVHYPIISTDMINLVQNNVENYNNRSWIARSYLLSRFKVLYYWIFWAVYRICGRNCDVVMVNSSWTRNHVAQLWGTHVQLTYPPCNTEQLKRIPLENRDSNLIISLSQFRPEKNHQLQLEVMRDVLQLIRDEDNPDVRPKLVVIGNCRGEDDRQLVDRLRALAEEYNIVDSVEFKVNISFEEIFELISKASIAIHTMKNEHFGISVVEFLAAGLLTLADNSGGPQMDIIKPIETGFLANSKDQFVRFLYRLLTITEEEAHNYRKAARDSVDRFSEDAFEQAFVNNTRSLFES